MTDAAKDVARSATDSPVARGLARGGYVASGVVHLIIGVIVLVIAAGGRGEGDQAGAFTAIAAAPLGFVGLWVLALLLAALGLWHVADGILVSRASEVKKWGVRIAAWGRAAVFLGLAAIAASVAIGARPDGDESAEEASRGLLRVPGGGGVLALIGIGIGIGGIAFLVIAVRRTFRDKLVMPDGRIGTLMTALGVMGYAAKGVALVIVGVLLLIAAVRVDPEAAGGLDAAIRALLEVTGGPFLVGFIGAGLAAYGVYCFFRARYARL